MAEDEILVDNRDHIRANDISGSYDLVALDFELEDVISSIIVALVLQDKLLDLKNDIGQIFDNARKRSVLMTSTFDFDGVDRKTWKRGEQDPSQGITDRDPISLFQGSDRETACIGIDITLLDVKLRLNKFFH